MKRLSLNYLFAIVALFSLGFMTSCGDDEETPAVIAPEFVIANGTPTTLCSQYASTCGTGSFFASSTGATGNSTSSDASKVDITYVDAASSGTASDLPTLVSPDARTTVGGTNQSGATTTYFGATSLDFTAATAQQVKDAADPTAKTIQITVGSTYIFKNAAGKKGLIKVTGLPSVATSTPTQNTTNAEITVKVLK